MDQCAVRLGRAVVLVAAFSASLSGQEHRPDSTRASAGSRERAEQGEPARGSAELTQEEINAQYREFLQNLRQEPAPTGIDAHGEAAAPPRAAGGDREAAAQANERLRDAWQEFIRDRRAFLERQAQEAGLLQDGPQVTLPQRVDLARTTERPFDNPPEIRSRNGVLRTRLIVDYADNVIPKPIGEDRVRLRNYNGQLVGPTLRARPGDTLRIVLENRLTPDSPDASEEMNEFHDLNTTNLHTHGLHVSPVGNSDNVMLQINGDQRFEYEINIPEDHPAGTFWYHAHKHGSVSAHVASGMAGALIVEGGIDEIPEIAAMEERIFVLQQLSYAPLPNSDIGVIELANVDTVFGPGRWAALQRHTSINGRMLPRLSMRPGEIQRWRFVMAGVRENVFLKLVRSDGLGGPIPLHEIAVDGLPLGKVVTHTDPVELWPGYRSDLLVEAPLQRGEYLLVDDASGPDDSINGIPQPLKFLARVVVEGDPMAMALPDDEALRPFRLPSIPAEDIPDEVTQETVYAIGGPPPFLIDGEPYDPEEVRHLDLEATDKWTLRTGGVFDVPHVFHIHVNPFEILSDRANDNPDDERITSPIWRDTYTVRPGRTVTFVTRYRRYIGEFVQHCHILDHEDLGMMQQISIDPPGGLMHGGHAPAGPVTDQPRSDRDPHAEPAARHGAAPTGNQPAAHRDGPPHGHR